MALLERYDPPAHLSDLDAMLGHRQAWHLYLQQMMSGASNRVALTKDHPGSSPFYDATTLDPGPSIEQDIVWNAFPSELLRRLGREEAFRLADIPIALSDLPGSDRYSPDYNCRRATEYCEWHVDCDPETRRMRRVTFTTESPEYWQAMFGGRLETLREATAFANTRRQVLRLYRELVSPEVQLNDLIVERDFRAPGKPLEAGEYNLYNKWNVDRGIVHLTSPPNCLKAVFKLAAAATRRFEDESGRQVVEPEAISAGARLGNVNRNSDIAIVGSINALARQGRRLSLANPVGVYIDHVDLSGWKIPGGFKPEQCVRVVRGGGRSISRLIVEVPSRKFDLNDVSIGGIPLKFGGQIAECITVRLRAIASMSQDLKTPGCPLFSSGYVDARGGSKVELPADAQATPAGMVPAFGRSANPALSTTSPPCGCPSKDSN